MNEETEDEYVDPFSRLPQEIIEKILTCNTKSDLMACSLVSRRLNQAFKSIFIHDFFGTQVYLWDETALKTDLPLFAENVFCKRLSVGGCLENYPKIIQVNPHWAKVVPMLSHLTLQSCNISFEAIQEVLERCLNVKYLSLDHVEIEKIEGVREELKAKESNYLEKLQELRLTNVTLPKIFQFFPKGVKRLEMTYMDMVDEGTFKSCICVHIYIQTRFYFRQLSSYNTVHLSEQRCAPGIGTQMAAYENIEEEKKFYTFLAKVEGLHLNQFHLEFPDRLYPFERIQRRYPRYPRSEPHWYVMMKLRIKRNLSRGFPEHERITDFRPSKLARYVEKQPQLMSLKISNFGEPEVKPNAKE